MKGSRSRLYKSVTWAFFALIFSIGIIAGYIYFSKKTGVAPPPLEMPQTQTRAETGHAFIRIYCPEAGGLELEERLVEAGRPMPQAVIEEFLGGSSGKGSYIPEGARLLGIYNGNDDILYIDLSDEFKGNFQGDAMAELLVLKGLFKSITSNVSGVGDIKVLIGGKEADSLGGHLSLLYPLKDLVSQEIKEADGE